MARLIDADALMMHLANIKLASNPDERESWYLRERALAVCVGIEMAMDAVEDAPTAMPNPQSIKGVLTYDE